MKKKIWISIASVSVIILSITTCLLIANRASMSISLDLAFTEQITIIARDTAVAIIEPDQVQDVIFLLQDGIEP